MTSAPRPFFGRVESLRGLGTLAIAGYHFAGMMFFTGPLLPDVPWPDANAIQNGIRQFGVTMLAGHAALMTFFVISGFVLRVSLEHGPQQPTAAAARFFLSRIFRLYPIVIFAVAVSAVIARPVPLGQVVTNMLLLDVSLNEWFWALQVELLMAPVIVVLYFLERRYSLHVLVVIAIATSALAFKPSWAWWPPLSTNVFAFVLGMLVPTLGRRFVAGRSRFVVGVLLVATLALFLPNLCFGRYSRFSGLIEAYGAFAVVSLAAYRHDLFVLKWLDAKPLRWLGLSSGSYYVLHMTTIPLAIGIAAAVVPVAWRVSAPALVGILVLAVWLAAIAPITLCTYYLIEAPGIGLGKRVMRRLGLDSRSAPATPPVELKEARWRAA